MNARVRLVVAALVLAGAILPAALSGYAPPTASVGAIDNADGRPDDPQVAHFVLAPTLGRLAELVGYFAASGAIRGNNTERILLDRLERAGRFEERDVGQPAANALQREVELLLELP